ncbi:MAG: VCBS repeat-containing protein [Proteobacteria bacterium]|nr:VCBS repeat-containing protein [Pseudomonadota bacterium]
MTELSISPELLSANGDFFAWNNKRVRVYLREDQLQSTAPSQKQTVRKVAAMTVLGDLSGGNKAAASSQAAQGFSGSKPFVSILCKFSDVADEPRDLAYFNGMYSNTPGGMDHYWRENSYAAINVEGSTAIDWVVLPGTRESYIPMVNGEEEADLSLLFNDCTAAADPLVDFSNGGNPFQGINMMFNDDLDGFAWGGSRFTMLDGVNKSWSVTWEPPWGYANNAIIAHEMGHGFGLPHSTNWDNDNYPYDNLWDVMSRAGSAYAVNDPVYGQRGQHTNAYHKAQLGWISGAQLLEVGSGIKTTVVVDAMSDNSTANYRMIRIPIPGSSDYYTVESRLMEGDYDGALPGNAVIIYQVVNGRKEPSWAVDTDNPPANTNDNEGTMFRPGETFTDAGNSIVIKVEAATVDGFRVTVDTNSLIPPVPTGVNASDGAFADHTRINWNASPGATGYRVYRCAGTSTGTCGSATGFPTGPSFDDPNGSAGTSYYYRVKACANGLCSAFSAADQGFRTAAMEEKMRVNRFLSFDADQKADVSLRNMLTGRWEINFLNNRFVKPNSGPTWLFPSLDWEMQGTGDFNGNGTGDFLLRNRNTGGWWIFLMNGRNFTSGKTLISTNVDWEMAGIGDFDGDGRDDVLLRNKVTGRWQIFFLNNRFVKANSGPTWLFPSLDWEMMGTADVNGNGRSDVILRNRITGGWWIFIMNGRNFTSGKTLITQNMDWQIAGIGDFDGDTRDDVLLRNKLTGRWQIFFLNNRFVKSNSGFSWMFPSLDWVMQGTGDVNANNRDDVVLRNSVTGGWWIFIMNGRHFTSGKTLITTNQDWEVP